ncbi:MAG: C-terminal binding protein [Betaproteobacteria bacterium]|nr:C-terminal binding protein [Betaproteobacteria bacterium]MDE2359097.1 C-terminal binding protein [Betaproteobacteria bacterium]
MSKILFADHDFPDIDLERGIFAAAGVGIVTAQCRTEADVIAAAQDCRGILLQYAPITEGVVAALPALGIVSRIGAGFDTVDTAACEAHGVWVANCPDYGVGEVATHALALALASLRNVVRHHDDVRAGKWHYLSAGTMQRPAELTLGIVGLGRIGKRMAHVSRNVFKRVVAHDPLLIDGDFPAYVERAATLAELAGLADVVSLHVPLDATTRGMINRDFFAAARRGLTLVNTARGAVVELPDLLAALDAGILRGVALDVLPTEPVPRDLPLLADPRAILTPHAAFYSVEAERELRRKAARNIVTWFRTGRPDYPVVKGTRRP